MTSLAALGHAYRWNTIPPAPERFGEALRMPDALALPWLNLARALDVPRVGSAWNLHVCNWKSSRVGGGSPYRPEELSAETMNVAEQWLPHPYDEQFRYFSLVFVLMEAEGTAAVRAAIDAIEAAAEKDVEKTAAALDDLRVAIDSMRALLSRYLRSPFVEYSGWLDYVQPTMPWAVAGEGLSGPNGLQLATIQALDATLGVPAVTRLAAAALENRAYMPPHHRHVLAEFDDRAWILRSFVAESRSPILKWRFNECVKCVRSWRLVHLKRALRYARAARVVDTRVSTGLGIPWRDDETPETGVRPKQDSVDLFEQLAADRIHETVAATVLAPPQVDDIASDDVAFAFLTADERMRLLHGCPIRRYVRGEQLIEQGKRGQSLFLLESGTAQIAVDGVVVETARVRPGDVVGEVSFVDGGPASASVIAEDNVEAIVISRSHIQTVLADDSLLAEHLYRSLALLLAQRLRWSNATDWGEGGTSTGRHQARRVPPS